MKRPVGHPKTKRYPIQTSLYLERDALEVIDDFRGELSRSVFVEKLMFYLKEHPKIIKEALKNDTP